MQCTVPVMVHLSASCGRLSSCGHGQRPPDTDAGTGASRLCCYTAGQCTASSLSPTHFLDVSSRQSPLLPLSSRCHLHSSAHQQAVAVLVILAAVTKFHGLGGLEEGFLTVLAPGEESTVTVMAAELLVGTRCPTCRRRLPCALTRQQGVGGCRLFLF